jgi:hypothetical protein
MASMLLLLLVSASILFGADCHPSGAVDPSKFSDALILVEGAQHPNYVKYLGTDQIVLVKKGKKCRC